MAKEIKNVEYGLEKIFEGAQDFLPLLGTDYVELPSNLRIFIKPLSGFNRMHTPASKRVLETGYLMF